MKKTNRKLVLRSETTRELAAQALTRIIGGQETNTAAEVPYSRDKVCLIAAVPHSGDKVCLTA
jgi:hypothetical protein